MYKNMKKEYQSPQSLVVKLEAEKMLASSPSDPSERNLGVTHDDYANPDIEALGRENNRNVNLWE